MVLGPKRWSRCWDVVPPRDVGVAGSALDGMVCATRCPEEGGAVSDDSSLSSGDGNGEYDGEPWPDGSLCVPLPPCPRFASGMLITEAC